MACFVFLECHFGGSVTDKLVEHHWQQEKNWKVSMVG